MARDEVECRDFLFFSRYGIFRDLLHYLPRKMKSFCFIHEKCSGKLCLLLCDVIRDPQEPMKLLHLYELLYKLS